MARKTWLVGDGPQSFLDPLDKRSQRHHLLLFGEDSEYDQPSVRNQKRYGDLNARFLSQENARRNSYLNTDDWCLARDEMAGGQVVTEGQTAHREIEIVGYISQKEVSIHEAHRRITGLGGKVGSAHWPAKDQAHGSWHVNVHDADKWESHVVESSLNRDPATAPRTPPRSATTCKAAQTFQQNRFAAEQPRGSRGSDHSIIQYLTPEAQQRFRSHVSELQDRKKGNVSVVG
jgi:hypothetical protein